MCLTPKPGQYRGINCDGIMPRYTQAPFIIIIIIIIIILIKEDYQGDIKSKDYNGT